MCHSMSCALSFQVEMDKINNTKLSTAQGPLLMISYRWLVARRSRLIILPRIQVHFVVASDLAAAAGSPWIHALKYRLPLVTAGATTEAADCFSVQP